VLEADELLSESETVCVTTLAIVEDVFKSSVIGHGMQSKLQNKFDASIISIYSKVRKIAKSYNIFLLDSVPT